MLKIRPPLITDRNHLQIFYRSLAVRIAENNQLCPLSAFGAPCGLEVEFTDSLISIFSRHFHFANVNFPSSRLRPALICLPETANRPQMTANPVGY